MRKTTYLCVMMLLSMNMMAQIDPYDRNWNRVFQDDFTETGRSWKNWLSYPDKKWMGYPGNDVISGRSWYHIYQYSNCLFSPSEGMMKLVAEFDFNDSIPCNCYELPGWMHGNYPASDSLFYFSGHINARRDSIHGDTLGFQFGYFEIRCKMPKHMGAHPAFWLHGASPDSLDPYYEEIDIFEYSWSLGNPNATWLPAPNPNPTYPGDPKVYSTAIAQNFHGQGLDHYTDGYGIVYPRIPAGQQDISGWHTYACEWMPDHVYWYLDGNLVNSYYDQTHIPRHHLILKANYGIDQSAVHKIFDGQVFIGYEPDWKDTDTLTIDYIKVYQLEWDCDTDEVIASQNDLQQFPFAVKKSITIAPINEDVIVRDTDKVTLRATDCFEISGSFEVLQGGEFTVIMQKCPE